MTDKQLEQMRRDHKRRVLSVDNIDRLLKETQRARFAEQRLREQVQRLTSRVRLLEG